MNGVTNLSGISAVALLASAAPSTNRCGTKINFYDCRLFCQTIEKAIVKCALLKSECDTRRSSMSPSGAISITLSFSGGNYFNPLIFKMSATIKSQIYRIEFSLLQNVDV